MIYFIFICIIIVYLISTFNNKLNLINLHSNKITEGCYFKIFQISDLHNNKFFKKNEFILSCINFTNPDIIVITGDLIDRNTTNFNNIQNFIESLIKLNSNIYFIPGNHEMDNPLYYDFEKILNKRINVLKNTNLIVNNHNNLTLNIYGYIDKLSNHIANKHNFNLLLTHNPNIILKYTDIEYDLILSGHTHGGQIRLPFIGALFVPGQKLIPKYDKGLFKTDKYNLYIDSGIGCSNFPIRFLNRPQVTLITINAR